jgi:hypothetical protein
LLIAFLNPATFFAGFRFIQELNFARMNRFFSGVLILVVLAACKHKKKTEDENGSFFSVLSYIQSQVKQIDTSLYRLIRIETVNNISDTLFIKREDFRAYAKDFLSIPDISSGDKKDDYQESNLYDDMLKSAVLNYTAKNPDDEIRRETVMLDQDPNGNSLVNTIIIDQLKTTKDSSVEKNMLWQVNKRFQVVTKSQLPGQPEKIRKLEVVWNDFPN